MAIYDANLAIKQNANAGRTREAAHKAAGHVLPFVEPLKGSFVQVVAVFAALDASILCTVCW